MSSGNGMIPHESAMPGVQSNTREFSREQVELIKRTIAVGTTDDELKLFVATANRMGLDPFARQIFAVKRWNANAGREVMQVQVSIDGFRLVAERTGNYAPGPAPVFVEDAKGKLISATAYVKKWARGEWHTVEAVAYWSEFAQTKKDGTVTAMWARMPHVMLAKCAEAQALRKAFPAELSGVYTPDEMAQADTPEDTAPAKPRNVAELKAALKPATPAQEFDAEARAIAEGTPPPSVAVPEDGPEPPPDVPLVKDEPADSASAPETPAAIATALVLGLSRVEHKAHLRNWRKAHAAEIDRLKAEAPAEAKRVEAAFDEARTRVA